MPRLEEQTKMIFLIHKKIFSPSNRIILQLDVCNYADIKTNLFKSN